MRTVRDHARRLTMLLTIAFASACATASGGAPGGAGGPQSGEISSRDALTADQLAQSTAANLFDAIQQLRPEMLNGHHLGTPDVYVDNVRQSTGMDRIKQLTVNTVAEVHYVSPSKARQLPGEVSDAGALVVTLK